MISSLFLKTAMAEESKHIQAVWKENRKVLFFLLRFLGAFGSLRLLYAFWVDSFGKEADSFSWFVGRNLQFLFGADNLQLEQLFGHAAIAINFHGNSSVSLFEGCNGLSVMILFFSFLFAFGGSWKKAVWFAPSGVLIIHLFNLGRLSLLVLLVRENEVLFHFMHKYLFTLIIYMVVFLLWVFWIRINGVRGGLFGMCFCFGVGFCFGVRFCY